MAKVHLNGLIRDIHNLARGLDTVREHVHTVFPKILSQVSQQAPLSPEIKRTIDSYEYDEMFDRVTSALTQLRFANARIEAQKALIVLKDGRDDALFYSLYWEKNDIVEWVTRIQALTTHTLVGHIEDEEIQGVLEVADDVLTDISEYRIGEDAFETIKLNVEFNAWVKQSKKEIKHFLQDYLTATHDYISEQTRLGVRSVERVRALITEIGYDGLIDEFNSKIISEDHGRVLSYIRTQIEDVTSLIRTSETITDEIEAAAKEAKEAQRFKEIPMKLVL